MKWKRIVKDEQYQPVGKYQDWKQRLADEGAHQCVYCAVLDAHYGGIRNFHVEHYRPKSLRKDLEHIYSNLFYACGICNTFKGDDWPCEPDKEGFEYIHYPDPSKFDYSVLFSVDPLTAMISGRNVAARYIVEKLHLNRAQILRNRKLLLLSDQLNQVKDELAAKSHSITDIEECRTLVDIISQISDIFHGLWLAVPYESVETR